MRNTCPGAEPGPRHAGAPRQLAFQIRPQAVGVGPGLCHQTRHEPVGLVEEGEEEVLTVDLGVAEAQRLGLGVVQRLLRLLGEPVHVHGRGRPSFGAVGWPPALCGLQTGDPVEEIDDEAEGGVVEAEAGA